MAAAVFLDTNLLVYPHDRREPERAERAVAVLDERIWATAKLSQIPVVLSEDFADGRAIEGVRFDDPFRDGFRLALP